VSVPAVPPREALVVAYADAVFGRGQGWACLAFGLDGYFEPAANRKQPTYRRRAWHECQYAWPTERER
jgi:hypothetical protein